MNKPNGYDTTQAQTGGFTQLPPGAYNCVIKSAYEIQAQSGKNMIQLQLDIADGEFAGYFKNQYESARKLYPDTKWRATYNQLTEGDSLGYFKGLIQDIQDSNPGYIFDFNEEKLSGKKIGGVFGREQYKNQFGEVKFATKCFYCVAASKVKDMPPPKDKLLDPAKTNGNGNGYNDAHANGIVEDINVSDDLPF
jgi:hypothetical protein